MRNSTSKGVLAGAIAAAGLVTIALGASFGHLATPTVLSGTEHISIVITSATGGPAVAHGLFTDVGTGVGGLSSSGGTLILSKGHITFTAGDDETTTRNTATCTATVDEHGPFTVVSGTGAYSTLEGSGTYHTHGVEVFPRTPTGCNFEASPTTVSGSTTLTGVLDFGGMMTTTTSSPAD